MSDKTEATSRFIYREHPGGYRQKCDVFLSSDSSKMVGTVEYVRPMFKYEYKWFASNSRSGFEDLFDTRDEAAAFLAAESVMDPEPKDEA